MIADDIKELPNDELYGMALAEMEKSKSVVLHMDTLANMEVLNKIKDILQHHPGNAQVYLSVGTGRREKNKNPVPGGHEQRADGGAPVNSGNMIWWMLGNG